MNIRILQSCLLGVALVLGGCASGLTGDTYSRDEARAPQTVRMGTVESVRLVQIEGTKTNIGTGAGAVVGGVAGSSIGGGRGRDRKSTRLNSSHVRISYAVFCLKKKRKRLSS